MHVHRLARAPPITRKDTTLSHVQSRSLAEARGPNGLLLQSCLDADEARMKLGHTASVPHTLNEHTTLSPKRTLS